MSQAAQPELKCFFSSYKNSLRAAWNWVGAFAPQVAHLHALFEHRDHQLNSLWGLAIWVLTLQYQSLLNSWCSRMAFSAPLPGWFTFLQKNLSGGETVYTALMQISIFITLGVTWTGNRFLHSWENLLNYANQHNFHYRHNRNIQGISVTSCTTRTTMLHSALFRPTSDWTHFTVKLLIGFYLELIKNWKQVTLLVDIP